MNFWSDTDHNSNDKCESIYVQIEDIGETSIDPNHWNGIYSLDKSTKSFNASIWNDDRKWLKYIEMQWILCGHNNELLIYQSTEMYPPTNTTSIWKHEFEHAPVRIHLTCSSSSSPTHSPTVMPSHSPSFSPTLSHCHALTVSDASHMNHDNISRIYFDGWVYLKMPQNDYTGRPIWRYQSHCIDSFVQCLPHDGWTVFVNDGYLITTYSTGTLFGYFPPLNTTHFFNITANGGLPTNFTFNCVHTDYPTHTPTTSPTIDPTKSPTHTPTHVPSIAPVIDTQIPTMRPTVSRAPSVPCDVLQVLIPKDLTNDKYRECISFHDVFGDTFWVKQVPRSHHPSWALDCNDNNKDYTRACGHGYSGSIYFMSNQWEIQIHNKHHDCLEIFVHHNSTAHFIPIDSTWVRQSNMKPYVFGIECSEKIMITTSSVEDQFLGMNTMHIYDEVWFWMSLLFIVLICGLLCFGVYCWKRQRKPIVVHAHANNPIDISVANVSPQYLELQQTPNAAYVDYQVAPTHDIDLDDDEDETDSIGDTEPLGSTITTDALRTTNKKNTKSDLLSGERGTESTDKHKALDMIAGKKEITGGYISEQDCLLRHDDDIC